MKKQKYLPALLLPVGMLILLLQGCYTQVATIQQEEPSYRQEEQYTQQNDSTYNNDSDNWQPHNYVGFSYYYPGWCSNWAWDYGCVYPTYWDPWYWGPAFYIGYSYYPHYWGYWNSYSGYNRWAYGSRFNYSRPYASRNIGYQRSMSSRGTNGVLRSAANNNIGSGLVRGGVVTSHNPGTAVQSSRYNTSKNSRIGNINASSSRQSNSGRYNLSVQQPRHRGQGSASTNRSYRSGNSRGQGSINGQSRTSGRAPGYSPRSSTRTSSAPSGSASRNDGGGGRQSSGSGRSGR